MNLEFGSRDNDAIEACIIMVDTSYCIGHIILLSSVCLFVIAHGMLDHFESPCTRLVHLMVMFSGLL